MLPQQRAGCHSNHAEPGNMQGNDMNAGIVYTAVTCLHPANLADMRVSRHRSKVACFLSSAY